MYTAMIVDDNLSDREGLKDLVNWEELGVMIAGLAANGMQGYEKALEYKPDFILSDVAMPLMDGLKMAGKIKEQLPRTKFIFMSCFDEFDYVREAMKLEAYAYVLKPIRIDELSQAVEKVKHVQEQEFENLRIRHELEKLLDEKLLDEKLLDEHLLDENLPGGKDAGRYNRITEDIKAVIDKRYAEIDNIEDITASLYISSSHANLIFKRYTGMTIFEYVIFRRMEEAKKLLSDPYSRVYEVAEKVGYTSKSYFGSVFKEYTGLTPKQYADRNAGVRR